MSKKNTVTSDSLARGLKEVIAYKQGEIELECVEIEVAPVDAKVIREKLGLTQKQFSEKYKISLQTLRNWEQKRRVPHGHARILLLLIQARPEEIAELLRKEV